MLLSDPLGCQAFDPNPTGTAEARCDEGTEEWRADRWAHLSSTQVNEVQEQLQRAERDRCSEKERNRQIQARLAEEPIFLPHLQEPMLVAQLQPLRLVDQVRREPMDVLIQKTMQPEPPPALLQRGQPRPRTSWAGKPKGRPLTFSRLPFPTQFTRTLSKWGMTAPPRAMMPKDWLDRWEAAKKVHALSQTRGGFAALSGPGFKPTASALP